MRPIELAQVLPLPGPVWGSYPQRPADDVAPPWRRPSWPIGLAHAQRVAQASLAHGRQWRVCAPAQRAARLAELRGRLRRGGLQGDALAQALGVAAACAEETLGWVPRDTQRWAAVALLDNRMAEMATGEGKTLAIALAAAVAALCGMPVHVVTANAYLAGRDAARLAPLYAALGLCAQALAGDDGARRAVYASDIVYASAKELAFDFLRDRQRLADGGELQAVVAGLCGDAAPAPLMRGLCIALIDEADSVLLDEADVPLVLARSVPQVARRAFLWQALALARQLDAARHFELQPADHGVTLTPAGEERIAVLATGLGGPWARPRYRREAVLIALTGLHAFRRQHHYLVRDGQIVLLDEVTGRVAEGRVWSRGLQTVVALKEGLKPTEETETVAQISFQRFFQRYWRVAGISGTLREARAELRAVYGAAVVRIPLHQPSRRIVGATRHYVDAQARFDAAAARIAELQTQGRPVLVGTDSVADSEQLSRVLQWRGIAHRVLNALHDADEAQIVAAAGVAGTVTVATRMAGRGTDIELDATARAAGGLHVLCCQDNPSRRLDRQLAGRAARHGDPGSEETWHLQRSSPHLVQSGPHRLARWIPTVPLAVPACLRRAHRRLAQRSEERRRAAVRRDLLKSDRDWERRLSYAGASQ